jgi:circadian clock protein KaiB
MTWPEAPAPQTYILRLFVAGTTLRSQRAISHMRAICDQYLAGRFDLEVIDVYINPQATREYQIVATPTLVKVLPEPLRRIIGDLSDHARVLRGLNITALGGSSEALA